MMTEYPFNISSKNVEEFEVRDTFNNNTLKGYIRRDGHSTYGMLYITHVNDKECPQYVWATPKMVYPFDRDGNYIHFENVDRIEVYEKLDGTNILGYTYFDAEGNEFVSYKTRLRPTLEESRFGNFRSLWSEMLDTYPEIPEIILKNKCNISFELYGKRNKILVEYDTLLDCAALFGVFPKKIVPPTELKLNGLRTAKLLKNFTSKIEFIEEYEALRKWLNENIFQDTEGIVRGIEGTVWYVISESAIQYKAKPDLVLDVHWKDNRIPKHSILITVINAYEETDNPSFDLIKSLLLEEFQESDIVQQEERIRKIMNEVAFEKRFKAEIKEKYLKENLDIVHDKRTCMRYFAQEYDKKLASKIYSYLSEEFAIKDENK